MLFQKHWRHELFHFQNTQFTLLFAACIRTGYLISTLLYFKACIANQTLKREMSQQYIIIMIEIFLKCSSISEQKQWNDIMFWSMHSTSVISLYVLHQTTRNIPNYKKLAFQLLIYTFVFVIHVKDIQRIEESEEKGNFKSEKKTNLYTFKHEFAT